MSLPLLCTGAVLERLEAARHRAEAEGGAVPLVLAFDADGTLWTGDIGVDGFSRLVRDRGVRPEALAALRHEAELANVPLLGDPNDQAETLLEAYAADRLDHGRAYRMMAFCYAGRTDEQVRDFARFVVEEVGLRDRVYEAIRPIVAWGGRAGLRTLVVSASPAAFVSVALPAVGLDIDTVVAMTPETEAGVLLPRVVLPAPYDAGKPAAIALAIGDAVIVGAFGNSPADLPMLAAARQPVAVAPTPKLAAARLEALVELAVVGRGADP